LEAYLNLACASYFHIRPNDPLYGEFASWVLGRMGMTAKVDLVAAIMDKIGVAAAAKPVLARVTWVINVRNSIAHSHLSIDIEDDGPEVSWEPLLRHRTVRVTRQGRSNELTNTGQLQRDRDAIVHLGLHLSMLIMTAITPREGISIAERLNEFYGLNPDFETYKA
jgi:hypothetical protein